MPYLSCPSCRLSLYTAAANATTEQCPRCDARLVSSPRQLFQSARQGDLEPQTTREGKDPRSAR
jgi:hypothetical protein